MRPVAGLYAHIPFCRSKCAYCDFASYPGLERLHDPYVRALHGELERRAAEWQHLRFHSLYVGGGTPTVLPAQALGDWIRAAQAALPFAPNPEITVEANPGTVTQVSLAVLCEAGVNRLSLGAQSLRDAELRLLGRGHAVGEVAAAVAAARAAGLDNLNLDLIYGLPCQRLSHWRETLRRALDLEAEHLSLYALSLEEGTPLAVDVAAGRLPAPDDDLAADMYLLAGELLAEAGYRQYEISNWARGPGEPPVWACQHNLGYWRNLPYLGLGAAAWSYDGRRRWGNVAGPEEYIARIAAGAEAMDSDETVDARRRLSETLMLGLRLTAGLEWADLESRTGTDVRAAYAREIAELEDDGLLAADARGLRLTPRGRLLGNRVFAAFLR